MNIYQKHKYLLFESLDKQGWFAQEQFFSSQMTTKLLKHVQFLEEQEALHKAKVGRGIEKSIETSIRKSNIVWIEDWNRTEELVLLNQLFNDFMQDLKKCYFLALKRFESHFAVYPSGGFYKKHLDQLKGSKHRLISVVYYLSDCTEGGELVLYKRDDKKVIAHKIQPKAGTLVVFRSDEIYHEVKLTFQKRYSMATWFRDDMVVLV